MINALRTRDLGLQAAICLKLTMRSISYWSSSSRALHSRRCSIDSMIHPLPQLSSTAASCTRRTRSWTEARAQVEPPPSRIRLASFCESSVKYLTSWACHSKLSTAILSRPSVTIRPSFKTIARVGYCSKSVELSPTSSNQRRQRYIHLRPSQTITACSLWPLPSP